jgi:hypothetical protein
VTEGANQLGDGLLPSKASASSAAYQHQKLTHTERGNSWGLCAPIPAVVHDNTRDWMASRHAGLLRDVFPTSLKTCPGLRGSGLSHSHRVAFPSLTQSRKRATGFLPLVVRAYSRCAGSNRARDLSDIGSGSRPAIGNTLPNQHVLQTVADRFHVTRRLSSSPSSAGFKTSSKDLTCEAQALSSDDKIHD